MPINNNDYDGISLDKLLEVSLLYLNFIIEFKGFFKGSIFCEKGIKGFS